MRNIKYFVLATLIMVALMGTTVVAYRISRNDLHMAIADSTPQKFTCLPKDVPADEVVSYGLKGTQKVTVEKKLIELKARCRNGKLVDAKGREIRFFRLSCWGNPPLDYLEIQQRENKELAELKKRYTVIVFSCNPMIQ